jgi:hypothetical protein
MRIIIQENIDSGKSTNNLQRFILSDISHFRDLCHSYNKSNQKIHLTLVFIQTSDTKVQTSELRAGRGLVAWPAHASHLIEILRPILRAFWYILENRSADAEDRRH